MFNFNFLVERLQLLEETAEWGESLPIRNHLIIDKKAQKIIKKNPTLQQAISKKPFFRWKRLAEKKKGFKYGFNLNIFKGTEYRGVGTLIDKTKPLFELHWIGTHEVYNKL